jgi:hypothetical protein
VKKLQNERAHDFIYGLLLDLAHIRLGEE